MRILLAGMVARDTHRGGATCAVLQWVLGLRRLGHDVLLVEQLPVPATTDQRRYAATVARQTGVRAVLFAGPADADLRSAARGTDVLINLSGVLRDRSLLAMAPIRVYVDLDPAFTQIWHVVDHIDMGLDAHSHHVTVGLEVGRSDSTVPTCGLSWLTMPPPVVLDWWPAGGPIEVRAATSVGHWRSYGSAMADGRVHGQRAHAFRQLFPLPSRTRVPIRLALDIAKDEVNDLAALARHGWELLDPLRVAASPAAYRQFVAGSWGELGVAKSGYVVSRSGWFSDRSACYLASGRPVVAQDTGWSAHLPTGEGLLPFDDVDDAAAALDAIAASYPRHSRAARRIAEECFDSDLVLARLLSAVAA